MTRSIAQEITPTLEWLYSRGWTLKAASRELNVVQVIFPLFCAANEQADGWLEK